jgi:ferredoxin--NADP+ reductase
MFEETVTSVQHWSDRTFSFRTTRTPAFRFNAGEFVMIGIMHEGKRILRAYSIVSPPWSEELEFLSIKIADGALTSQLQHINIGDQIIIGNKPTGTLRNDALLKGGDLWLLATGTGLAPFMSLIQDLETLETWSRIHVVHSVQNATDLAYHTDLTTAFLNHHRSGELHETIKESLDYQPVVTGQGDPRITAQLISGKLAVDPAQDKIMLCGNMAFNKEVMAWCSKQGMIEGSLREPGQYVIERAFVDT